MNQVSMNRFSTNKKTSFAIRFALSACLMLVVPALLPAAANADDAKPCAGAHRQMDYWLGEWSVSYDGVVKGSSKVELSLDQCLIVETWVGARNHTGKSMFAYSSDDDRWYGMFADNEGRVHVFTEGKVSGGNAEFQGTSRGPKGEVVLNRVKFVRMADGKVAQAWEKSSDDGATWSLVYRAEYLRK